VRLKLEQLLDAKSADVPRSRARRVSLVPYWRRRYFLPGILAAQTFFARSGNKSWTVWTAWNSKTARWPKRSGNCARIWRPRAASRRQPAPRARRESGRRRDPHRGTGAEQSGGASQHFPIRVTGMALFNGFLNSQGSGGQQYPTFAWPATEASGGASIYQTTIGLEYSGPQISWAAKCTARSTWISRAAPARRWIRIPAAYG
jgi:hypothetical protein